MDEVVLLDSVRAKSAKKSQFGNPRAANEKSKSPFRGKYITNNKIKKSHGNNKVSAFF
jgi:hypothetical protein